MVSSVGDTYPAVLGAAATAAEGPATV